MTSPAKSHVREVIKTSMLRGSDQKNYFLSGMHLSLSQQFGTGTSYDLGISHCVAKGLKLSQKVCLKPYQSFFSSFSHSVSYYKSFLDLFFQIFK